MLSNYQLCLYVDVSEQILDDNYTFASLVAVSVKGELCGIIWAANVSEDMNSRH